MILPRRTFGLVLAIATACGTGSAGEAVSTSVSEAVTTTVPPNPNTSQPPSVDVTAGPLYPPTSDVEANDIPFQECDQENGRPVPQGDELARLTALRQQITDEGLLDQPLIVSSGGPESVDASSA